MNTNLGDAAFDAIKIYKTLFEEIGFQKAFIPLKTKLTIEGTDYTVNENGIPCCPHDPSKVKKTFLQYLNIIISDIAGKSYKLSLTGC